jgi:UDP-N-acetylglucosamine 1-carboxyvinyltransferase
VVLENLPSIADVAVMVEILRSLGVEVETSDKSATIHAAKDPKSDLPASLCSQLRGSVTMAGPLLARTGRVFLPKPGGDRIGRRRLDTHILALQALGAKVITRADGFELKGQLTGADVLLDEASVTATENAICAAVLAQGQTTLRKAFVVCSGKWGPRSKASAPTSFPFKGWPACAVGGIGLVPITWKSAALFPSQRSLAASC